MGKKYPMCGDEWPGGRRVGFVIIVGSPPRDAGHDAL